MFQNQDDNSAIEDDALFSGVEMNEVAENISSTPLPTMMTEEKIFASGSESQPNFLGKSTSWKRQREVNEISPTSDLSSSSSKKNNIDVGKNEDFDVIKSNPEDLFEDNLQSNFSPSSHEDEGLMEQQDDNGGIPLNMEVGDQVSHQEMMKKKLSSVRESKAETVSNLRLTFQDLQERCNLVVTKAREHLEMSINYVEQKFDELERQAVDQAIIADECIEDYESMGLALGN